VPDAAALDRLCVNTIKALAIDAIQAANSGHPGAPMGMADIAYVLWTRFVRYDPGAPDWEDRDRVVLSAGHASMLLYSMLHLTGTSLSLADLRRFRQWGSRTPGHPEVEETPGVETTTGPLGQGVANGVGMALAERWLAARFGADLVDHHTWVLCGDGCLMEGVAHEAASLAGHLGLGRLTVLYDDNRITIDGGTDLTFSEDVTARFAALGWHVARADGHDHGEIAAALEAARAETDRPSLVAFRTTIAHGSPNLAGSNKTHGSPLGEAEVRATKEALGLDPDATFAVPDEVPAHVRARDAERAAARRAWEARLGEHPQREAWERSHAAPDLSGVDWPAFEPGKLATRKAGHRILQALAAGVDNLVGGSADLAGSNGTWLAGHDALAPGDVSGRNVHFGIREHGMAAICNGISLHGGMLPYCATFLVFHDYMRPAVRLAGLMRRPVVYVYTHDSVFVGEDGPTHQPVEQLMALRSIPNLWAVRPADATETAEAWRLALSRRDGPTALCLSRQGLPVLEREGTGLAPADGVAHGGYVLAEAEGEAQAVIVATGSEVHLALAARASLQAEGIGVRVVSLPCWELFDLQEEGYRTRVLPHDLPAVSVEAGITTGWERYVGRSGARVGIDRFGASAPGAEVASRLGVSLEAVVGAVRGVLAG